MNVTMLLVDSHQVPEMNEEMIVTISLVDLHQALEGELRLNCHCISS
jgi:hypothetical protein